MGFCKGAEPGPPYRLQEGGVHHHAVPTIEQLPCQLLEPSIGALRGFRRIDAAFHRRTGTGLRRQPEEALAFQVGAQVNHSQPLPHPEAEVALTAARKAMGDAEHGPAAGRQAPLGIFEVAGELLLQPF